jgi:hypothetical protein
MRSGFRSSAVFFLGVTVSCGGVFSAEPPERVTYRGVEVWKLTDKKTEAYVVPEWGGRVIHYARVGGENWLWTGDSKAEIPYFRWGGDKTFPGPHPMWNFTLGKMWPPPTPDAQPHDAAVREGRLVTTSPPWDGYGGARVVREYSFSEKGEFVVRHGITPVKGSAVPVCAWVITQCVPSVAYVPIPAESPYREGFCWLGGTKPEGAFKLISPVLMEVGLAPGKAFKLGTPSSMAAIAARRGREVFVQKADFVKDVQYPDGAPGAGLTAEYYHHNVQGPGEYIELELLSPLRALREGVDFTTRWSLHMLGTDDSRADIEGLLK